MLAINCKHRTHKPLIGLFLWVKKMIQSSISNILLLTIPRTGTHFTQHFLFEGQGRIVPMGANDWLNGKNPISYQPDHCLIIEHFHPDRMDAINQVINSGEDVRVVVPMLDLAKAYMSAAIMGHNGFLPGLDAFEANIDLITHHKFLMDSPAFNGQLTSLLSYCGILTHTNMAKYQAKPVINSARPKNSITQQANPRAYTLRQVYDNAHAAYDAGDLDTVKTYFPNFSDLENRTGLKTKLADFGYGAGSLPWL